MLCGLFVVWGPIRSVKTAAHLWASNIRGIFAAEDEGGLTPTKDDKGKSTE